MEEKIANGERLSLADCPEDSKCLIVNNTNKITKEIGINPGKTIVTFKNEPSDSNMIICLDSTRYIIAKSIAEMITVSVIEKSEKEGCRTTG
jgi:Fe2+ transport system protein FeoA